MKYPGGGQAELAADQPNICVIFEPGQIAPLNSRSQVSIPINP
jgi:hypothetical protein